jgi:molecular chaperone HtpG
MERILKSQALRIDNGVSKMMKAKKILEINPSHPLIEKMKTSDDTMFMEKLIMFDTALLASGFAVHNPCSLASRLFSQMTR